MKLVFAPQRKNRFVKKADCIFIFILKIRSRPFEMQLWIDTFSNLVGKVESNSWKKYDAAEYAVNKNANEWIKRFFIKEGTF